TRSRQIPFSANTRYTFVDVPLLLSMRFYTSDKLDLTASGGALFNLAFAQQGYVLGTNTTEVVNLASAQNPYRTYAGVNLMMNLGLSYKLNRQFDLLLEPGIRLGTGSLMNKSSDIMQRYTTVNCFTGLRYNF